jgi:integrase
MAIYKRNHFYWYKFVWKGELIRESTKQGNSVIARNMESAHRTALANGLVGIREKKQAPTLNDFLKADFLPFAKTKHASKPSTHRYYQQGADMLQRSSLGALRLDEITDQHAHVFAAKFSALSPSGINRGLRTLRRVLNLAYRWGKIEKPVKISLAQGERQRDRVLTEDESSKYIKACPQPWADCATTILDEAFRPSEVFSLRWPHLLFNQDETGLIQIVEGKSKAARRILPMTSRVYRLLRNRYEAAGCPKDGWVFPSASRSGHLNGNAAKDQHKKALGDSCV